MQVPTTNPTALVEHLSKQGTAPTVTVLRKYGYNRAVRVPGVTVTVFNAKATGEYVVAVLDTLYFFTQLEQDNWLVNMITVADRTDPSTLQVVFDQEPWQPRENGVSLVCTTDLVKAENLHTVVINFLEGAVEQGAIITYPGYRTTNLTTAQLKEVLKELNKSQQSKLLNKFYKVLNNA